MRGGHVRRIRRAISSVALAALLSSIVVFASATPASASSGCGYSGTTTNKFVSGVWPHPTLATQKLQTYGCWTSTKITSLTYSTHTCVRSSIISIVYGLSKSTHKFGVGTSSATFEGDCHIKFGFTIGGIGLTIERVLWIKHRWYKSGGQTWIAASWGSYCC